MIKLQKNQFKKNIKEKKLSQLVLTRLTRYSG
jgi:hypothetical protein